MFLFTGAALSWQHVSTLRGVIVCREQLRARGPARHDDVRARRGVGCRVVARRAAR